MNTVCDICNKKKEHCFICKGVSSSTCLEHNENMTTYNDKPVCKSCILEYKCTTVVKTFTTTPVRNNVCNRFKNLFIKEKDITNNIECDNIKKYCPTCRKKDTLNCPVHNLNINNTCEICVKLFICQICNEKNETTWYHNCGRFCVNCVKKIEVDVSHKTLYKLFNADLEPKDDYKLTQKWEIYCEKCIDGEVIDVQKRYFNLIK